MLTHPLFHVSPDLYASKYNFHNLWEAENQSCLISGISDTCEAVVTRGEFTDEDMAGLPNLKLIAVCGVGYDGVDVDKAISRNINVTHTPNVLTEDVADLALGLLLAAGRKIVQADRYIREGRWGKDGEMKYNFRVHGKKLGIVGLGRIGLAISRRCDALSMEVGYHNRSARRGINYRYFDKITELANWCDYLVISTPGGQGTYHLIDAEVLSALGPTGILINVGRGTSVDQIALIDALQSGTIAGAALDVIDGEPVVPDELLQFEENLILQPHQASATFETRQAMVELTLANVDAMLMKEPLLTPVPEYT